MDWDILELNLKTGSSIIICSKYKKFKYVIVRDHLWNLFDQIKIKLPNHLLGHVDLINSFLQSSVRILYT